MTVIDVVALGELVIDFTCLNSDAMGYPVMAAHPGGAPANFLAALQKYGQSTAMLAKVGDDAFGRMLCRTLREASIAANGVVVDHNCFTTLAFVTLDDQGDREFSFSRKPGADTRLQFSDLDLSLIDTARVFHFGTVSLTDEPARSATHEAVAYAAAKKKLISFDPNLRKPLWGNNLEEARAQMDFGLHAADIVKISDEELAFLFGNCSPEEGAAHLFRDYGVRLVYITMGRDGCYIANGAAAGKVGNFNDGIRTVDTTGAGDIFGGAAMSRFLTMHIAPEELDWPAMRDIGTFACAAASLSTEQYGGIYSVPDETAVLALVRTREGGAGE